ncbi:glycerate kinase [Streptomyces sp. SAI-144]|uniref:isocitrate/isopropylmalate family dehydrogenase n=1 Tax=Streptomyces sp. SAI-144 TaxID=2940544 RepID=UPI0024756AEA|nr:isocitrate/isopropylmalate family dehydrogenase [Streptomyces sp. SAI-144]MDH6436471.1 glycerate kinase [Streptomyces sp. SAI-144]
MVSVLISPDKFKGSLSADEAARALERGLLEAAPRIQVDRLALSDGGEGSVAAACAGRFSPEKITVTGPNGRSVTAEVAVHGRIVLIEAAAICGLAMLPGGRKMPLTATSRGIGQALRYALAGGADTIVLALGGVATTDGGAGMLQSLGAVLAEEDGTPIGPGGAKFVLRPEDLSVVVASNLNADILSDLGSALAGSLGLAASANLNPERRFPSMFEPVHGSAPDIAGQGLANPIGAVGSAALMLEHFGLPDQAARLNKAIEATTGAGILTRDVGGTATTDDVVKALTDALDA